MKYRRWSRSDGATVEVAITTRADGDFHIDADANELERRRHEVLDGPWAVVRQVHGSDLAEANHQESPEADGVFTDVVGQVIAVQGADCAPIGFVTSAGPIGVVHAGWRGLAAGVVEQMARTLSQRDAIIDRIVVGPTIGVECYEFGRDDLDNVAALLGDEVRGETSNARPALDLTAAIRVTLERLDLGPVEFLSGCTACERDDFYSYRARSESQRHAMAMRIRPGLAK